jgi:hypothetical protein
MPASRSCSRSIDSPSRTRSRVECTSRRSHGLAFTLGRRTDTNVAGGSTAC